MKKLLSLLAVGAMAMSAYATDYYLIGGFNGWALKDANCKFTDAGDGTFTLDYNGTLSSGFKINDGSWNDAENYGSDKSNPSTLIPGEDYALTLGSGSGNIPMNSNVENPSLVFNPTAKTLLIKGESVEAEYKYVLRGNWDGGTDWSDVTLTESNGVWTLSNQSVEECNFGIKKTDASTGAQVEWISAAAADNASVVLDTPMACKVEGTNFSLGKGKYTFSFDPEAMTLTVTGEGDDPTPPTPPTEVTYVLHGNWDGGTDWSDMTLTEANGVWAVSDVEISACNFGIKKMEGTEQKAWISSAADDATVVLNTPMNCKVEGTNFSIAAGKYSFSFNPETMTLTVTGKAGEDPEPPTNYEGWYFNVPGEYNNWIPEGVAFNEDGTAESGDLNIGTGEFEIKVWDGKADTYYAYTENNGVVAVGQEYVLTPNTGAHMTIEGAKADSNYKVFFNVETKTMKISVGTGVESIEVESGEAVYFNLQGQRVENPANGLFVRVLNGKATKVMVK